MNANHVWCPRGIIYRGLLLTYVIYMRLLRPLWSVCLFSNENEDFV